MELNKAYCINIISRTDYGSFIVVEKLNSDSSQHFLNYYEKLLRFNKCGEWFQDLDYPEVDIGSAVIVKINQTTNLWARGIISKLKRDFSFPEIYLIDYQRFLDNDKLELRMCPPKFANLVLPTYNIDINLGLENDLQNSAIEMFIDKNRNGELGFTFTLQSIENNVYHGKLLLVNDIDNSSIPLQKLLKNIHTKKYFTEISEYKQRNLTFFDPLAIKYMQTIFIPKNLNSTVTTDQNNSLDSHSSCNSSDESSILDCSEYYSCSEDSELSKIDHIKPIVKPKVYSSSSNSHNSIIHSTNSFEKGNNNDLNSIIDSIYEAIIQSNEQHEEESSILEITADYKEENELNTVNILNTTKDIVDMVPLNSYCEPTLDISDTECLKNNNVTANQNKTPKLSTIFEKKFQPINSLDDDSIIWWSSDDEC